MIRLATLDDVPRALAIAATAYPGRGTERAEPWVRWAIPHPDRLCLIGAATIGMASLTLHYGFELRARLDLLASTDPHLYDAMRMVRAMVRWARQRGAVGVFKLDSDTGVDFGPFARRLGGRPVQHARYEVPL